LELRGLLADVGEVFLNDEFSYNGASLITNDERIRHYKWYLTKNLFYFDTNEVSSFGREKRGRSLTV
jgi:hypothetical protein